MAIPIFRFALLIALAIALPAPAFAEGESFCAVVLRAAGMAPGAGAATDPDDEIDSGALWLANLNTLLATRITGPGYHSPVFTPAADAVLAIKDDRIFRIPIAGGDLLEVYQLDNILKLVGFLPDGRLLIASDDGAALRVGLLAIEQGKLQWLTPNADSPGDRAALERIRGWDRVYGRFRVTTERQVFGEREWTEVVLEEAGRAARAISDCQGVLCGQAAFAPEKRLVVFVKSQP
jgi:hypothetical protein